MLLAVSGGVDSSVMADVIYRLKESGKLLQAISCEAGDSRVFWKDLRIGVAHVNFHLRGEDSDRDQEFVRNLSQRYGFEFFTADLTLLHTPKSIRFPWRLPPGNSVTAGSGNSPERKVSVFFLPHTMLTTTQKLSF